MVVSPWLLVVRRQLSDEKNAFTYFEKAAAQMKFPEVKQEYLLRRMLAGKEEWDEAYSTLP